MLGPLDPSSCMMGVRKSRGRNDSLASGRLKGAKWILSGQIGGSEDTTQESPAQDPSLTVCHRPLPGRSLVTRARELFVGAHLLTAVLCVFLFFYTLRDSEEL